MNETKKKTVRINIDITPEERRKLRMAAAMNDMTVSEFVRAVIRELDLGEYETVANDGVRPPQGPSWW